MEINSTTTTPLLAGDSDVLGQGKNIEEGEEGEVKKSWESRGIYPHAILFLSKDLKIVKKHDIINIVC